jgi:membrane-associated protease RseP (regulator of RpoE activity)
MTKYLSPLAVAAMAATLLVGGQAVAQQTDEASSAEGAAASSDATSADQQSAESSESSAQSQDSADGSASNAQTEASSDQATADTSATSELDTLEQNADSAATDSSGTTADANAQSDVNAQSDANANANQPNEPAGENQADAEAGVDANASAQTQSDTRSTDAAGRTRSATDARNQRGVVPPSRGPNAANAQQERSLLNSRQQSDQSLQRQGRASATVEGRANADLNVRGQQNRDGFQQQDLRRGIQFGRATDRGLAIDRVESNSFYHTSGIRRGDVIVSLYGRPVRSEADFVRFMTMNPGQRVPVVVWRGGRQQTIYIEPDYVVHTQHLEENRPLQSGGAYLGVTFDSRSRDGVVILSVNPGSPAEEAGLQAGDLILALNDREVRTFADAISMIRAMRPGEELHIVVERARQPAELVAVLDAQPNVRTATRPENVYRERQTVPNQYGAGSQDGTGTQYDSEPDARDRRLLDRDRNADGSRDRGILPRLRD